MSGITPKKIEKMIYVIKGQKVMLDSDLAELYGVLTKNLNKAVKRNIDRFPSDFMFKLTQKEYEDLRFQFGTFKNATKGRKYLPHDFMFELTKEELENWRYQFGTSNKEKMGLRVPPFAFTEQGVTMLSSDLKSSKVIQINISIVRTFIKMRKLFASEESFSDRVEKLEKGTDKLFRVVFERLDNLEANTPLLPKKRKRIGLKK